VIPLVVEVIVTVIARVRLRPTPLALRMPLQAFRMAMLWWSAVKSRERILPQCEVV
jgi:hypothetical protein